MTAPKTAGSGAPDSASATGVLPLAEQVKTLQFAWFAGHAVTVLSGAFYLLTYVRVLPGAYKLWYKAAFLGAVESFGVLIYQLAKKLGVHPRLLLRDDNVHYLFLAAVLFVRSPYVLLTLSTFLLFSTFHVLSYARSFLFPAFDISDSHPLSVQVGSFVSTNNHSSIAFASLLEVYTVGWMLVRVLTLRPNSLLPLAAYVVFIKLRFEKSAFTRNAFKSVEVGVEGWVNKSGVPAARSAWVSVKGAFHQAGAFLLVNDHTKEKSI
ncbi:hypothetical protein METBIDRAFT_139837 [Metschnikowia bicuspidata var. bicuspidata NRRL YB-4993]|uniref:Uncharacterized protein n=1 Tax=Metschnikowia bicuspidata var. bicuspidata NRRL YB-4993 TaxID=869754 RepID=A0A1A0HDE0_9ASCO|nr:hypothetical protein METBIDRAFT_139837 [Metschnikowia bicuspidata var. bicuspidata NRRL YB-4993]OBA21912.1 hypothetical protein METBIDRAFT_139837 [Metschnikowia bicuspidata var. bicuspidata NRRL YB-4993]